MTYEQHLEGVRDQILKWRYSTLEANSFLAFYKGLKDGFFRPPRYRAFVDFYNSTVRAATAATRAREEARLASGIAKCLRGHIAYREGVPFLSEIPATKSGNCVALSSAFFAVGTTLDLKVVPVSTVYQGEDHLSLLVELSDGTSIGIEMATEKGSAGYEFRMREAYEEIAVGHYRLRSPNSGLFHREVHLASEGDILASIVEARAGRQLSAGSLEAAVQLFSEALELSTSDFDKARIYQNRAAVHEAMNRPELQFDDLSNSIECSPHRKSVLAERALMYGLRHDYARALSDVEEALKLDPSYAKAYRIKAGALKGLGDLSGASEALAIAKKLDPVALASIMQSTTG